MNYQRSQTGWIMIILFTLIPVQISYSYFKQGSAQLPISVYIVLMTIMIGVLLTFYKLKVTADQSAIRISFGIGLIKFNLKPRKLRKIEIITVPWYYGLGIRMTPQGMLYNVHGSKAVRITYQEDTAQNPANEKTVTIGTDDPQSLHDYLQSQYPNPNN